VERLLVTTQKRRSPGLRVGTASCPDQVRLANGTRFTCTVQIEGTRAPYRVTLRDVDPARATGRFALEPAKPLIDVTRVVALIRGKLQPTARGADVRCGTAKVRVVEVGSTIACTITLGDASRRSAPRSRTSRARSWSAAKGPGGGASGATAARRCRRRPRPGRRAGPGGRR